MGARNVSNGSCPRCATPGRAMWKPSPEDPTRPASEADLKRFATTKEGDGVKLLKTADRMGFKGFVSKSAAAPCRSGSKRLDQGELPELMREQPRTLARV